MTSELLDVEEAAIYLHIKTSTVRSWILKGQIAYCKIGRRVCLRKADLDRYIADSVVPARAAARVEAT